MGLGKDDKLGHVRDTDDFAVHLSGEIDRFLDLSTVYQPESRKKVGKKQGCKVFVRLSKSVIHLVVLQQILFASPCRYIGSEGDTVIDEC